MEFQYKNVLIWGYGISGKSVEKVLIDLDVDYTILDEGEKIRGGGFLDKITCKDLLKYDLIVLSPGVDFSRKEIKFAIDSGIEVMSEVEFGYMFLNENTKVIAVTGTNGKTTTVELIYNLLKLAGKSVVELGNIGKPFSEVYGKKYDYAVVELSSFQLELCKYFKPYIAIVLNIAPDHIDRHGSYANYVKAKLNIFRNQQKDDYAIMNIDDEVLKQVKGVNAKKLTFSKDGNRAKYHISDGRIYSQKKLVLDLNTYAIPHIFYEDILVTGIVADVLKLDFSFFNNLLSDYRFLSHRCEFVTTINNIMVYNDSKATNIHASEACVKAQTGDKILLLLGGRNKGLEFDEFITNMPAKVVKIIAFGECRKKIFRLRKFNKNIEFIYQRTLRKALDNIHKYIDGVDTILFSPACASFDEFSSYIARGDYFKRAMLELKEVYEEAEIK